MKRMTLFLLTLTIAAIFAPSAIAQNHDKIHVYKNPDNPREGTKVKEGDISRETMTHVHFAVFVDGRKTGTSKVAWNKVRKIDYANEPYEFSTAKREWENYNAQKAIDLLNQLINKDDLDRDLFRQKATYLRAKIKYETASSEAEYADAISAYEEFMNKYPRRRGYRTAAQNRIQALTTIGRSQQALDLIKKLNEQRGLGSKFNEWLKFQKARIFEKKGEIKKARKHYGRSTGSGDRVIAIRSRLGVGNCQIKLGNFKQAENVFDKVIQTADSSLDNIVLAGAHNGKGRVIFETKYQENPDDEEQKKENIRILKNALLHFYRGVILYKPEPGSNSIETERAMFWTARTYEELAKNVMEEKKATEYRREALRIANTLINSYPKSEFRKKAENLKARIRQ